MIDLDLWNAFCEVSPWGSFLFTLQKQKKLCTNGDEAIMKIHKKLFSGIPFNFTLFVSEAKILDLKLGKYGLSSDINKYTTSGWTLGDENESTQGPLRYEHLDRKWFLWKYDFEKAAIKVAYSY